MQAAIFVNQPFVGLISKSSMLYLVRLCIYARKKDLVWYIGLKESVLDRYILK